MNTLLKPKKSDFVRVKISAKFMRLKFVDCNASYIVHNCKGSCCQKGDGTTMIAIAKQEVKRIRELGGIVHKGILKGSPCMFKNPHGLCTIHKTGQPLGCGISPFALNKNNTLIIRHRYLTMKCHKEGTIPAYKVFRRSLDIIFGEQSASYICRLLDDNRGDFRTKMKKDIYKIMKDNESTRRKAKI